MKTLIVLACVELVIYAIVRSITRPSWFLRWFSKGWAAQWELDVKIEDRAAAIVRKHGIRYWADFNGDCALRRARHEYQEEMRKATEAMGSK